MTVPTMQVCLLTMWSMTVPPFEAGQYVTCKRCETAALMQLHTLSFFYGSALKWTCEWKDV